MFSRSEEDLIRLDSGHPEFLAALVFEGDHLRYLEVAWGGLADGLDQATIDQLLVAARELGYVLSVRERLGVPQPDGSFRERLYLDHAIPDPIASKGEGVHVLIRLGFNPETTTAAFTAEKMAANLAEWGADSVAATKKLFPGATVVFEAAGHACTDIECTRLRGERSALRAMARKIFTKVSSIGL